MVVTARHMHPSFVKIFRSQKTRKRDVPAVVTALPMAAPPIDFREKAVRWSRTFAPLLFGIGSTGEVSSSKALLPAYLWATCSE